MRAQSTNNGDSSELGKYPSVAQGGVTGPKSQPRNSKPVRDLPKKVGSDVKGRGLHAPPAQIGTDFANLKVIGVGLLAITVLLTLSKFGLKRVLNALGVASALVGVISPMSKKINVDN